jgi:bifunctional enzyme CysN/CysC
LIKDTGKHSDSSSAGDDSPLTGLGVAADRQTVWLTGLPGAGKTTIARATERLLHELGVLCYVLDGDDIRNGLSSDLGLSRADRCEQARRVAHMAAILADAGVTPIVALVSPYAGDRQRAREVHEARGIGFLEVWVNTPLEVCVARDPKGLYAASARSDSQPLLDGSGLTGVCAPYETPTAPDLLVSGTDQSPRVAASEIVARLIPRHV